MTSPPSDVPVERIGRYDVLGLLATGGMAEILLARLRGPSGFERPVVIKRILPHLARQKTFREMFLDEARVVAQIRHPNVVQVHELGDERNELFLVMEYLEGESLGMVVKQLRKRQQALPPRLAAQIIVDACAGLHAAHELTGADGKSIELVHRDVSPQNLFVLYSGQVKLIDFGIAKAADRTAARTATGQLKGKFTYMAPEQVLGEKLDRRADVFALGVILHELLTGQRLFARDNELLVFRAICEADIPPPSKRATGVPPELDAVCAKALERSLEDRYPSALAMRRDLLAAMRSLPGDEPASEELGVLMAQLFDTRLVRKQDMLRQARAGQALTYIPATDTGSSIDRAAFGPDDAEADIPTTGAAARSGPSFTGGPGQVLSLRRSSTGHRSRWLIAAGVLVVLGGAAAFGVPWLRGAGRSGGAEPAEPSAAVSASGAEVTVHIASEPSAADVLVNGERRGQTPLDLRLPKGTAEVTVEVRLAGHRTVTEKVAPTVDQRLSYALLPEPAVASASAASASASASPTVPGRPPSSPAAGGRKPPGGPSTSQPTATPQGGFTRVD